MPHIASVGTAVPKHVMSQKEIRAVVYDMFKDIFPGIDRLISIFDHGNIEKRHFCVAAEWFQQTHTPDEKHRLYVEHAAELAEQAIRACLEQTDIGFADVDHIIFVSTTGTATPSIDALLFNRMGFNPHIKRTPIWGLGCAGGAASLSRAADYVKAFPSHRCLVVSVELCSLTFLNDDLSKSNFVATSLFADGAAAALVLGETEETAAFNRNRVFSRGSVRGPRILQTQSTIWPDTLDVMGWEVTGRGLKVIFSRDIPSIIQKEMYGNVEALLKKSGLALPNVESYILHPGGMKVLQAYRESLHLPAEALHPSETVLRQYGNMSSATVFFVLQEAWRLKNSGAPAPIASRRNLTFAERLDYALVESFSGADMPYSAHSAPKGFSAGWPPVHSTFASASDGFRSGPADPQIQYGIIGALGPGFSSEMLLFEWV
ncbi:type III polyketide synthase [Ferviditalea candida]|uniref:type III polyketide synthase n=1 Tax=Ferviditalea candida TaxID=3108399 RepID=UPI00352FE9F7